MNESLKEAIQLAKNHFADNDNYEVFGDEQDVLSYLPKPGELDEPMPEIWKKRIQACGRIIAYEDYPCIFDNENALVPIDSSIDEDGFKFNGEFHPTAAFEEDRQTRVI